MENDENGLFKTRYLFMKREAARVQVYKKGNVAAKIKRRNYFFLFAYLKN